MMGSNKNRNVVGFWRQVGSVSTTVGCVIFSSCLLVSCGGEHTDTSGTTTGSTSTNTSTNSTVSGSAGLTIALLRGVSNEILVTAHLNSVEGTAVTGAVLTVSVVGGSASEVTEKGKGDYEVTIAADGADREVEIEVTSGEASAKRTAAVFSAVDDGWEQAEALEGFVNTKGWEDGASVSGDGEWLLVGSYVPLDVLTCQVLEGAAPDAPSCNTVTGPYAAPERPDMLGAERILSATDIQQSCPSLNFPPGGGQAPFAVVPVAAYGFHRQADGSYKEPFVIGYAADGCLGPYGISFVGPVSGTSTSVLFANDDPLTQGPGESSTDIYWSPLELGQKNILAKYSFDGSKVNVTDVLPVQLALPDLSGTQGNVNFAGGRLWWDDESAAGEERELYWADVVGDFPGAAISATNVVGASRPGVEDIQPTFDGKTLYWKGEGEMLSSELMDGADPTAATSWSAAKAVFAPAPSATSTLVAVGEPTVAHIQGETWLYFVYIKKTEAGYDANVARIRKRF